MSYSVLVVDDSAIIRSMVKKSISMSGVEVREYHEAEHGLAALKIMSERWIDIVFVDLNMPVMGGAELVEKMTADDLLVSIPIVVVSADQNEHRIEELKKRGIRAYLKKPFRPESFREVVHSVLGHPEERTGRKS